MLRKRGQEGEPARNHHISTIPPFPPTVHTEENADPDDAHASKYILSTLPITAVHLHDLISMLARGRFAMLKKIHLDVDVTDSSAAKAQRKWEV
jgi:hypothetical protein